MLSDPDVAIVESRRVKCGLCDRWIKGSNTQEYSSHHWLKHKRKCTRIGAEKIERYSESAEARKTQLEADSSLNILEPHRALCGLCKKVHVASQHCIVFSLNWSFAWLVGEVVQSQSILCQSLGATQEKMSCSAKQNRDVGPAGASRILRLVWE